MNRRNFLKLSLTGICTGGLLTLLSGCIARINQSVYENDKGSPWRCSNCGYLTRSKEDLSNTKCPRCMQKTLKRITEKELQKDLKNNQ